MVLGLTFLQTCIYNAKSLDLSFRRAKEVFNNSVNGEFLRQDMYKTFQICFTTERVCIYLGFPTYHVGKRHILYHWAISPAFFLNLILRQDFIRLLGLALNSLCDSVLPQTFSLSTSTFLVGRIIYELVPTTRLDNLFLPQWQLQTI